MTRLYGNMHDGGGELPPDLEISAAAAAASAAKGSKDSYTKTVRLPVVKNKIYRFWATYLHEDKETKKITESDRSPVFKTTFDIPNLTKPVKNLTLTAGSQSYGVKFDLDAESVQEDVVIFESLTSNFATQNIVYVGTSTNVTILTTGPNAFANRWVKVRSRDRWDDLNISEATAGPIKPFTADVDTTFTVENPGSSSAVASIDPKDLSGFSLVSTISWVQSTNVKTAGYAIRWSTDNPSTVTNPLWEYASVSGIATTSFTATGLIPNTTYYYQVASTTPYDVVNWTGAASGTFIASDADGTAAGALARLRSFIAIGGASQDLFKIGTGITQGINLSTDPIVSPTLTQGTYHGIVLNKSTTNVGNNFWLTTGQFRVGNPTEFMYWNGTNLFLTGSVNATGGKFTGNVQLAVPSGASTSGTLYAGLNPTSGPRVRFSSEGIFAYDSTSTSNETGQTFSLVQSTGRLNANLGTVGGWSLDTTGFSSTNTKIESNGTITLGDTTGTLGSIVRLSATDNFRLWIGSQSSSAARDNYFAVSREGILYAKGAIISGNASFSGTLTVGTQLSDGTTIDSVKLNALKGITDASAAANAAALAKARGDQAYNEAIAAGQTATAAANAAQAASEAVTLRLTSEQVAAVLVADTTIINGSTITTGTINLARLNITGGTAGFNGFVVDGNGIRATSGGSQTLNISSNGTISLGDPTNGWTVDNQYIRSRSFFTSGYSRLVLDGWNGTIEGGRITASRFEANTITGGTITGSRIQTSTSGNRVELIDATNDSLRVLVGGSTKGHLLGWGTATTGGLIMHQGSTANPDATSGVVKVQPGYAMLAATSTNYVEVGGAGGIYLRTPATTNNGLLATINSTTGTANMRYTASEIFFISSTRDSKTNIQDISFDDSLVKQIRPRMFQGKVDLERGDTNYNLGLIAEELAEIEGLDLLVDKDKDNNVVGVNYDRLPVLIIDVLKRVLDRLDALEA